MTPDATTIILAPVDRVTLYEDRALVLRRARLSLGAGPQRLRVEGVSPVLADRTLLVRAPLGGARVHDGRVVRRWRLGLDETPADTETLHRDQQALVDELARAAADHALLVAEREAQERLANLLAEDINRQLPYATAFDPAWRIAMAERAAAIQALDERLDKSSRAQEDLERKLAQLTLAHARAEQPDEVLTCHLLLAVEAPAAGEHEIEISYQVPCALWRPIHRATLRGTALHFACEGAVWQATGEDWRDVELCFSTARSTQRAEPPLLDDDVLTARPRPDRTIQVSARQQQIATTGEGVEAGFELPGVDDGGEVRALSAPGRVTIHADGRLHRIPVFAFETDATAELVARPERGPVVHAASRQTNGAPHPILAGPVELLRGSGYVGRGRIGFVAPGEMFVLGWGGEDALRVRRELDESRETATLTGRLTITRTVRLHVSNLADSARDFRLEERIPVSELEQVTVEVDERQTEPRAVPDRHGIVSWPLRVPAHGTLAVTLKYRISAPASVQGL